VTNDEVTVPDAGLRRKALFIATAVFAVYIANFRVITEGDSIPARYLPFAIWGSASLTLDSVADAALRHPKNPPYWLWRSPEGHLLSIYPIVTPLLLAPLYAPCIPYLNARGWTRDELEKVGTWMEKIFAAAIVAASAGLLFLVLRRGLSTFRSAILTAGYALGTGTWAVSSQSLWQQGTAELLLTLGLLGATREPKPRTILTGLVSGLLIANRPPDVFLAAALLAFLSWRLGRRAIPAFLAASLAILPFLVYNLRFFHSAWGGYGVVGLGRPSHPFYNHPFLEGLAGLLVSPAKGLLVFSPFLVFLFALRTNQLRSDERALARFILAALLLQLLFYARTDWRAGGCYGNRFLLDALPGVVWLVGIAARPLRHGAWTVLAGLAVASAAIEFIGAFCYPGGHSDDLYYPNSLSRRVIAPAVWSWRNAPFLVEARAGLAKPDLLTMPEAAPRRYQPPNR
jgi:hypothetical protein